MRINIQRNKKISKICLCLLTPLFLTLSFPKFDLFLLGWIALVPLLLVVIGMGWFKSFVLSWIIGVLSFMGIFAWINQVKGFTFIHFLLLGLYLGIYFGIFGSMVHLFDHTKVSYPILVALIWVCLEYLRSHFFFLALPWALLGHSQYKNINLIQCASFTGVYGISFLMALVNASLAVFLYRISLYRISLHLRPASPSPFPSPPRGTFVLQRRMANKRRFNDLFGDLLYLWPVLFVILLSLWGKSVSENGDRTQGEQAGKIRVGLVQGNIPQEIKWEKQTITFTIDQYESLTKKVAREQPALIIWPETAVPIDFRSYPTKLWRILGLARSIKTPLICGAAGSAKFGRAGNKPDGTDGMYNSAFYISAEGTVIGEYRKIKLLPFGEYLPSLGRLSLSTFFPKLGTRFLSGEKVKVFPLPEGASLRKESFGITMCWENIFPDLFRKFVLHGASFMVNISNDGWFKDSAGPYQHLMCNVFRAVENRISIARAGNTGISCFISPFGRIMRKVTDERENDLDITGVAAEDLPGYQGPTFYTRYGDVFIFACIALLILSIFCQMIRNLLIGKYKKAHQGMQGMGTDLKCEMRDDIPFLYVPFFTPVP